MSSIKDETRKSAIKSLENYSENFNYQKNYQNFLVQNLIQSPNQQQPNLAHEKDERLKCKYCGILINSIESLKVHMQYQHEDQQNRWSAAITTTSIPTTATTVMQDIVQTKRATIRNPTKSPLSKLSTDLALNNSGVNTDNISMDQSSLDANQNDDKSSNNHHSTTVSAADSSDNQPGTPQPITSTSSSSSQLNETNYHQSTFSGNLMQQQEIMHSYHGGPSGSAGYPSMHYDQFYHHPLPTMDYSLYSSGANQQHAPASRYHPYMNHMAHVNGPANTPSSMSNSSLSPRVVSSTSPALLASKNCQDTSVMGQITSNGSSTPQPPTGQPTPSPSPKQCDKCGFICTTDVQLGDHYTQIHGSDSQNPNNSLRSDGASSISGNEDNTTNGTLPYSYNQQQQYIKEEPSSDILDLDSQKMVYPPVGPDTMIPQDQPLPPMHSMHPMHRPMMWGPEMHSGYIPPGAQSTDLKQSYYPPPPTSLQKSPYSNMKQDYGMSGMKQEYAMSASSPNYGGPLIKSEYHLNQSITPQTRADIKPFVDATDVPAGNNPVSSSPSEFPSTTTPQENGGSGGSQFRGFEPPSSSLSSGSSSMKATTWKSNEARRPKTYNCTACNKWFTSSGHLKRHYNTTLHKNAVKSSGHPDPATMPISAHHHPTRDPNYKHRSRHNRQPPPAPPEPPRSPEYTPQYATQAGNFTQQQQYQQQSTYNTSPLNNNGNGHPNGQAGPSVQTSQARGLLIISNMEANQSNLHLEQEDQVHSSSNSNQLLHSPREEMYHQHNNQEHQSADLMESNSPNSNQILEGQQQLQLRPLQQHQQQAHIISHHPHHIREGSRISQDIMGHHHHHHPIIHSTTPMHHNTIMDPDYINPLGINPTQAIQGSIHTNTIPSYHLQQLGDQHQTNYHTIIGNNEYIEDNLGTNLLNVGSYNSSHSMPSPTSTTTTTSTYLSTFSDSTSPFDEQPQYLQTTVDGTLQIVTNITAATSPIANTQGTTILNHSIVEVRRLSEGIGRYQENIILPYSPAVPDYLRQSSTPNSLSGEETEIKLHSPSLPYSPTVSSSTVVTSYEILELQPDSPNYSSEFQQTTFIEQQQKIVKAMKNKNNDLTKPSNKRRKTVSSSSSSTPSPTGKIECLECGKEFAKICYLTQHNKTFHSGEQPFRCQKCGKRFPSELAYDTHLAKHKAQDKPYKCDKCPKQFHHKTDLRRHLDGHSGYKAHVCETCSKGFCRKDHLRKHCDTHKPKPAKKPKLSNPTKQLIQNNLSIPMNIILAVEN